MSQELWSDVDRYICERLLGDDPPLEEGLAASDAAGLPPIAVTANQGKLLNLLVQIHGASRILEIGALGGYSTTWLARGLPEGGRLITLEFNPHFAEVALANLARAGLSELVEMRVGPALETLPGLAAEGARFDLIFIDADKRNYPGYFQWAIELAEPGTLIIADNVVRDGEILSPDSTDEDVQGTRRLYDLMAAEPRVTSNVTAIQTVGSKGHDGFAIALVT
jgi:predicted O-methyltransferase YrrM